MNAHIHFSFQLLSLLAIISNVNSRSIGGSITEVESCSKWCFEVKEKLVQMEHAIIERLDKEEIKRNATFQSLLNEMSVRLSMGERNFQNITRNLTTDSDMLVDNSSERLNISSKEKASGKCPTDWLRYRNNCYYISVERMNWTHAQRSCRQLGAHLAKVDDAKENKWIATILRKKTSKGDHILWLGATDIQKNGDWRWASDLTSLSFNNWDESYGEPNGGIRENCLNMINERSSRHGKWNDYYCSRIMYYICEKRSDDVQ